MKRTNNHTSAYRRGTERKTARRLAQLETQISTFEKLFSMSSDELVRCIEAGCVEETTSICKWLVLLGEKRSLTKRCVADTDEC